MGPSLASSILGLALFGLLAGGLGLWNEWDLKRWQQERRWLDWYEDHDPEWKKVGRW